MNDHCLCHVTALGASASGGAAVVVAHPPQHFHNYDFVSCQDLGESLADVQLVALRGCLLHPFKLEDEHAGHITRY
jgi:hypothetical protein